MFPHDQPGPELLLPVLDVGVPSLDTLVAMRPLALCASVLRTNLLLNSFLLLSLLLRFDDSAATSHDDHLSVLLGPGPNPYQWSWSYSFVCGLASGTRKRTLQMTWLSAELVQQPSLRL